jgi:hypothetical protein
METISNGTYPGSRQLTLYFNEDAGPGKPWVFYGSPVQNNLASEQFGIVPPDRRLP